MMVGVPGSMRAPAYSNLPMAQAQPMATPLMAGTQRYGVPQPSAQALNLLTSLREDLVGELQAINQYETHAMRATDPQLRALFSHIAQDERQHVAELTRAIAALDRAQAAEFAKRPHI